MNWTAPPVNRVDEPFAAEERTMLEGFLDYQRSSLLLKCAGLSAEQLALRAGPPSTISLLGLVRHLSDVERTWFRSRFGGERLPSLYSTAEAPDGAFDLATAATAEQDWATFLEEQDAARAAVAGMVLDDTFNHPRFGTMALRWAFTHMLAEYAQHNGHADLLREQIDGTTRI
jgi:hypothetical protein